MTSILADAPAVRRRQLALRLALRELRAGLRGFGVFIACIALGVAAIAGVGSFAQSLVDGLAREGQVILGGDLAFSLIQREATPPELSFLSRQGEVSVAATLRAMARTADGRATLVELKAVDAAYPLYGAVDTDPAAPLGDLLARRGDAYGAIVDPALLARLDLEPGARITIGQASFELRAALVTEPDKLAGGIGFGPRLMVSEEALRATGLLQPGSLVRWHYRLRLPAGAGEDTVKRVTESAAMQLPDAGWDIRTRANATPQIARNVERFTQYLTLVGLTALLVGGVGVANSTRYFLDRKRDVIATMKALGATGTRVFAIYFTQVMLLAAIGVAVGLAVGALAPYAIAAALKTLLPLPLAPSVHPLQLLAALAYGLLTAAAFSLWPLGRVHDVPVSALFRDEIAPQRRFPRLRYAIAALLAALALTVLAVMAAYDRRMAVIFVVAALAVFALLRLVAAGLMAIARRAPRLRSTMWRLAIANIHRPGALTPTVVLSLGLGLALLVTVLEIDANLRREFVQALPERAPSFFFLDIQGADADRFDAFVHAQAPRASLDRVPMLRGRIVAARGVKAADLKPRPDAQWVLHSDRGITFTGDVPQGSRVVEGRWWGRDYNGPPLLSFEKKLAEGLGLKIGDQVTVNVLGRNVTATIANLRTVDWESLGINFVLVFSPGAFAGAPVTDIATVTFPGGGTPAEDAALLKAVGNTFPTVTAVPVRDAIDAVGQIVTNLVLAIRVASSVTLVAAVLVLGGALAAGHRHRVYDAVILKTLGATRRQLITAYVIEYLLLGLATVLFGVAAGSIAAWRVVADIMTLPFAWAGGPAVAASLVALAITLLFGLIGTFAALGRKPAAVLRNL
ncbi:MAG TPA: FtsX-like permease family protein [Xanthobacteraceae bacterium]|nr:FtsX-like permease family protein [Xanthobacteraceae bacterium]